MAKMIVVVRDGKVGHQFHGEVRSDGTVWSDQGMPVTDGKSEFAARVGLDAMRKMATNKDWASLAPAIAHYGDNGAGLEIVYANEWYARQRAALVAAVPGLDDLEAARAAEDRYQDDFRAMMDDESNDGVRPPKPVRVSSADVASKYPVAAAYLKAQAWECASNYAKSGAGKTAKARIAAGEDCVQVISDMEAEWSAHCKENVQ